MSETSESKELPPSPKKLREARKKGQVANSKDFVGAVATVTALFYVALRSSDLFTQLGAALSDTAVLAEQPLAVALPLILQRLEAVFIWFVLPLLALLFFSVCVAALIGNGGLVFSADPLAPKFERINPISGFQRIFSLRNSIDGLKIVLKFFAVLCTLVLVVKSDVRSLVHLPACGPGCVPGAVKGMVWPLLLSAIFCFLILGGLDLGIQRLLFRREMRMTRTEQKKELKNSEGNPLIKKAQRQERRAAMGSNVRMGLKHATFVVYDTEGAVAFQYAPPGVLVPALVARSGKTGLPEFLEDAKTAGIPLVEDAEATRLLASRVPLGSLLPRDAFQTAISCMRKAGII
ncbi:EscU/YscU/HrcU family type III secretion system export apparatus switch protein [Acetobacter cibinongensis]|uniref:EscU/YscU/HrcU family type III secretion system export apparatus switch protein n=1 Tax=Acetobacter cibinongensis TaxID=146475 RepID=A0A0D6N0D4_9PROT|nr:EscU/YscU/HrcU family type III secretion system export apparatus switch protein [Acetobacter cibinongensis]GAN59200.1 translocation protein in type III secretion system, RhcU [Acetobacter cibinongensis]GBQ19253.1 type III secretion component EscU [Acetobacter cibinongensis NRIC 0482]GEL59578.1 EscU/YscU/HrcU family type III secretion system export apparatus switch protein [Acetobacter cibinongensis]